MAEYNGHSPYSKLLSSINALAEENIKKFQQIWEEIGYDEGEIEYRCKMTLTHTQQLFEDMLEEAGAIRRKFIQKVERLLLEASQLEKELGIQQLNNFDRSKLKEAERGLLAKVEEYSAIKQERMDRLAEYKRQEIALSEALGIPLRPDFPNVIPTNEQFEEYENYLAEKEEEKERLMCIYRETRIAILDLIRELGETPSLNFHSHVVYEDESKFKPTKKNMAMLEDYRQQLENQLKETKIMALELREKVSSLWERLQEDRHHRDVFLSNHQGYSASIIRGLKQELKRCEELKRQNIKKFVGEIRKELEDWWDKCLISEEEKNKFTAYKSTTYTEDLLELHELEVQRLKTYHEDNILIFELAIQRQKLWDKMLELERRANDPDRLFNNRGGQLLREEQERKNIQKELPKVEKELLKHLEEYEIKHGTPFYIEGESFKDRINRQWVDHKAHKESEKSARKARDHLSRIDSRVATNMTATKRKHPPTPHNGTSSKKRHIIPSSSKASSSKASRLNPALKKEEEKRTVKVRRRILDRTQSIKSLADTSQELAQPLHVVNCSNSTTYSDFQDHLEVRNQQETCRSSVAPSRYLRERNIQTLPKSTPLTPKDTNIYKGNYKTTPVKPPRKNIGSGQFSTPKTPLTVPRSAKVTPNRSIQRRGGATTPRLTATRGRLPIII